MANAAKRGARLLRAVRDAHEKGFHHPAFHKCNGNRKGSSQGKKARGGGLLKCVGAGVARADNVRLGSRLSVLFGCLFVGDLVCCRLLALALACALGAGAAGSALGAEVTAGVAGAAGVAPCAKAPAANRPATRTARSFFIYANSLKRFGWEPREVPRSTSTTAPSRGPLTGNM